MKVPGGASIRWIASVAVVSFLLMGLLNVATTKGIGLAVASPNNSGIVIPLYTDPGDVMWSETLQAKIAHPNVPIIAVINPNNGPGGFLSASYVTGVKNFQAAGIIVLGYVATGYARNPISTLESQVLSYWNWYKVNGIFFDEFANAGGAETYYTTLNSYVKTLGMTYTMGNPGSSTSSSYYGIMDNLMIYENPSYPPLSYFSTFPAPKNQWSFIAYAVGLNTSFEQSAASDVQWLYITDAGGINPYNVLPSYFMNEVAALDTGGSVSTTTTTPVTTTSSTTTTSTAISTTATTTTATGSTAALSISTVDANNNALNGFYIERIQDNTAGTSTGGTYTPQTVSAVVGHTYSVTVDDYATHYVQSANIGTFARNVVVPQSGTSTFTLLGNTNLVFKMGLVGTTTTTTSSTSTSTVTTTTSTTTTSAAPTATITVDSAYLDGTRLNGMWTTISSNGNTLAQGYTPLTFTGTVGVSYVVTASNWQSIIFVHWDDGSTAPSRAVSLTKGVTLMEYYDGPNDHLKVTLQSVSMTGTPFNGMWMQIHSGGVLVASGYTPLSFNSTYGTKYFVSASDWQHYVFDHWDDGTTNATEPLTPSGPTTLTAYYRTPVTVTIQSVDSFGWSLPGMKAVVSFGGSVYLTGSTTLVFTATWGMSYTVCMANDPSHVFLRWGNGNGNENACRTITPTQNTVLVAVYSVS